eukprot:scaffold188222_cov30-Tisochrysis_lutea.AAC.1
MQGLFANVCGRIEDRAGGEFGNLLDEGKCAVPIARTELNDSRGNVAVGEAWVAGNFAQPRSQ